MNIDISYTRENDPLLYCSFVAHSRLSKWPWNDFNDLRKKHNVCNTTLFVTILFDSTHSRRAALNLSNTVCSLALKLKIPINLFVLIMPKIYIDNLNSDYFVYLTRFKIVIHSSSLIVSCDKYNKKRKLLIDCSWYWQKSAQNKNSSNFVLLVCLYVFYLLFRH